MKLLQKISTGTLLIVGLLAFGIEISSASVIERDFGNFTLKIDKNINVTKNDIYTGHVFLGVEYRLCIKDVICSTIHEIPKNNIKLYKEARLGEESNQRLTSKTKLGKYTFDVYEVSYDDYIDTNYWIEGKNYAYYFSGTDQRTNAQNLTIKNITHSKVNTFKYYFMSVPEAVWNTDNPSSDNLALVCKNGINQYSVKTGKYTTGTAKQALESLITDNKVQGFETSEMVHINSTEGAHTFISSDSKLKSISIKNKIAYIDFSQLVLLENTHPWYQCNSVLMLKQQITKTLTQFPTIKDVIITINGVSFEKYFETQKKIIYDKDYDYEQEGDITRECGDYRIKSIGKLQIGSEGRDVGLLQKMLSSLYDIEVNGYFDTSTASAVKKFQINRKLYPADGIVGKNTRIRLNQDFNNC